jgi:hypothetical protein
MKKKVCLAFCCMVLTTGAVFAQEDAATELAAAQTDPRAAMAAMMAAEGMIMPGKVTTSPGRISLHGMIMTGLQGRMQDNTGLDDDEDWTLMPWDPVWQENGAKIFLTYENGRYGAYFMVAAEDWAGTIEEGMNNVYMPYAYLKDYYGEWGYVGNGIQNEDVIGYHLGQWPAFPIHWKYSDEVYGTVPESGAFSLANHDKPFDGSTRIIFGFNFKGVKNLTAKMQASFFNLGDFDRFGTGSIDETIGYAITPKFSVGANFYQDFYGEDAFPNNMINSPYFRFNPNVSYQLANNIGAGLGFTYGICEDVVESDWTLRPGLTFVLGGFGAFRVELYYELNAITYTDEAVASGKANYIAKMMQKEGGEAIYTHNVCLSVMWMF